METTLIMLVLALLLFYWPAAFIGAALLIAAIGLLVALVGFSLPKLH